MFGGAAFLEFSPHLGDRVLTSGDSVVDLQSRPTRQEVVAPYSEEDGRIDIFVCEVCAPVVHAVLPVGLPVFPTVINPSLRYLFWIAEVPLAAIAEHVAANERRTDGNDFAVVIENDEFSATKAVRAWVCPIPLLLAYLVHIHTYVDGGRLCARLGCLDGEIDWLVDR